MSFLKKLFGMEPESERSAGGSAILRHEQQAEGDGTVAETPYAEAIEAHFNAAFPGRETMVWHEIVSEGIHLDVCVMQPTDEEPYYVLYTMGMSARLMNLDGIPHAKNYQWLRTAELMMYLPADWPLEQLNQLQGGGADMETERIYWPVRLLKMLGRMPSRYNTWLGAGHSVPNGDPARPFADDTPFAGAVLFLPAEGNGPKAVKPVELEKGRQVLLYLVTPVTPAEMDYKLQKGSEALEEKLRELPGGLGFVVDNHRAPVAQPEEEEE